jgi:glucuronate isomerase
MKKSVLTTLAITLLFSLQAQVQIRPLPQRGYEQRIKNFIDNVRVVDTHEHLEAQAGWMKSGKLDFMLLLQHYSYDDIRSAGMPKSTFGTLQTDSLTVMQKWNILKPYWEATSNTAYCRAALLTADKLFGVKDLNETTVEELSSKIKNAYQTDWYNHVLIEKCGIDYVVTDTDNHNLGDPGMYKYVKRFGEFIFAVSAQKIETVAKQQNIPIRTLDDFVTALGVAFHKSMDKDNVAVKIGTAYERTLFFEDVSKERAEVIFNKILNLPAGEVLPYNGSEIKPLQDYMVHRILDLAKTTNTPVQIHTGLQAGDGNYIQNSNPAHLANLFLKYRDVKFILFHGGYPFGGELASLAKNFRNVYIDMCWLYIISPSYSERYLNEWLETVPASKIMAFGGDFRNVENIYGHLLVARQVVTKVLTEKVKDGYFTESEALKIAQMIFHDNAIRILKLDKR